MATCKCGDKELVIKIKYHVEDLIRMEKISIGDWIDLRAAEDITLEQGDLKLISLGVSMKLPAGYEANIVPRSSTAVKFGILQANHYGVVDNSYSGDQDIWRFMAYAIRGTTIKMNDRICQFRLNKIQPKLTFEVVDVLDGDARGGFGSTGKSAFNTTIVKG
jgi:dUTP pyrophosphatase